MFAVFFDDMLLQYAEGDGRFRCRTRLGDDCQRIVFLVEYGHQVVQVIFAHVVTGINDERPVVGERCEVVLQRFDDSTGAQIGTANSNNDKYFRLFAQFGGGVFDVGQQVFVDF